MSTVARLGSSRTARQPAWMSAAWSTARWKVHGSGDTAWISASVAARSTAPASSRKPNTNPAAPAWASALASQPEPVEHLGRGQEVRVAAQHHHLRQRALLGDRRDRLHRGGEPVGAHVGDDLQTVGSALLSGHGVTHVQRDHL